MRIVDLSHPLPDKAPVYPGDPPFALRRLWSFPEDACTLYTLTAGLHAGTHIDAPMHMTPDQRFIGDFPPGCFAGRGVLFNVSGQEEITVDENALACAGEGDIVLLHTGHGRLYAADPQTYFQGHPVVSPDLARRLADKRIKMLGMDLPAPDKPPFAIHTLLLSRGIFLLENLANLDLLPQAAPFTVLAFPLPVRAEASFTRAVAVIP